MKSNFFKLNMVRLLIVALITTSCQSGSDRGGGAEVAKSAQSQALVSSNLLLESTNNSVLLDESANLLLAGKKPANNLYKLVLVPSEVSAKIMNESNIEQSFSVTNNSNEPVIVSIIGHSDDINIISKKQVINAHSDGSIKYKFDDLPDIEKEADKTVKGRRLSASLQSGPRFVKLEVKTQTEHSQSKAAKFYPTVRIYPNYLFSMPDMKPVTPLIDSAHQVYENIYTYCSGVVNQANGWAWHLMSETDFNNTRVKASGIYKVISHDATKYYQVINYANQTIPLEFKGHEAGVNHYQPGDILSNTEAKKLFKHFSLSDKQLTVDEIENCGIVKKGDKYVSKEMALYRWGQPTILYPKAGLGVVVADDGFAALYQEFITTPVNFINTTVSSPMSFIYTVGALFIVVAGVAMIFKKPRMFILGLFGHHEHQKSLADFMHPRDRKLFITNHDLGRTALRGSFFTPGSLCLNNINPKLWATQYKLQTNLELLNCLNNDSYHALVTPDVHGLLIQQEQTSLANYSVFRITNYGPERLQIHKIKLTQDLWAGFPKSKQIKSHEQLLYLGKCELGDGNLSEGMLLWPGKSRYLCVYLDHHKAENYAIQSAVVSGKIDVDYYLDGNQKAHGQLSSKQIIVTP